MVCRSLGSVLNDQYEDKTILDLANQSFFLVKSQQDQSANFLAIHGQEHFSMTFEVDGLKALETLHEVFIEKEMRVGEVKDRGHSGKNFVFYDIDGNKFDVWSELSSTFKENYQIDKS